MAPRCFLSCCANSWVTSTPLIHAYTSFLFWPAKSTPSLPFKNSLICPVASPSPFRMRICTRPQSAHPTHSIFMIILYWKILQFHDHPVLEDSESLRAMPFELH